MWFQEIKQPATTLSVYTIGIIRTRSVDIFTILYNVQWLCPFSFYSALCISM